jgi:hypothetical protein
MAPDLIPPPSPAGRRPTDAGAEARAEEGLERAVQPAPPDVPEGPTPFRGRFGFVWGALAGTAVCAIAVTVALATTMGSDGPPLAKDWSSWKPKTSRMLDGAADIAAHVGREYKLDSGDQLASVSSSEMQLSGAPLGVAIRPRGQELQILHGKGLLYVLNGLGPNGTIAGGKATKPRGRLLMREAAELAMYSFRYLDDVTMVAVMLPPPSQSATTTGTTDPTQVRAIFYRPGDLLDKLQVPLARTLPAKAPTPKKMSTAEAAKIDSLALHNLFLAKIQSLDGASDYLVLTAPDKIE